MWHVPGIVVTATAAAADTTTTTTTTITTATFYCSLKRVQCVALSGHASSLPRSKSPTNCWYVITQWFIRKISKWLRYSIMAYGLADPEFYSRQGQQVSSSPKRSEQLQGPATLLFNRYWGFLQRGQGNQGVNLTTHLHLLPSIRKNAAVPLPLPTCIHDMHSWSLPFVTRLWTWIGKDV
jgi:hypothetical protein